MNSKTPEGNSSQPASLGLPAETAVPLSAPIPPPTAPGISASIGKPPAHERPILFSGAMVRAILEGRKTQTRRIMKPQPEYELSRPHINAGAWWIKTGRKYEKYGFSGYANQMPHEATDYMLTRCPYGKPGDRLYVRETWGEDVETGAVCYKATPAEGLFTDRWRPSIHMPRKLSRITLEVVSVRVERLQDISEFDAAAEGVPRNLMGKSYRIGFENLWNSIHGTNAFENENQWVWVVEFRRL